MSRAQAASHTEGRSRPSGWQWPLLVVTLLALNACMAAVAIYYATTDKTFAVEPDYYRKAMNWDSYASMRDASAKLGWKVSARVEPPASVTGKPRLMLNVVDRENKAVSDVQFRAVAFHRARAADRIELALSNVGEGLFECEAAMERPGLWEVRVVGSRGRDVFAATVQAEVASRGSASRTSAGAP